MENKIPEVQSQNPQAPNTDQPIPFVKKSKLIYVFWGMLTLLILTFGASATVYISKIVKSSSFPSITPPVNTIVPTSNPNESSARPLGISGWKSFTSQEDGYSLEYPQDWYVNKRDDLQHCVDIATVPDTRTVSLSNVSSVNVFSVCKKEGPMPASLPSNSGGGTTKAQQSPYVLSGHKGFRGYVIDEYSKHNSIYIELSNNSYVVIDVLGEEEKIPEQILSTFKFTEKNTNSSTYSCPTQEWIDCMPKVEPNGYKEPSLCNKEYLEWAKQNCPEFKGAAY